MSKIKIRHKYWYWGNFILDGSTLDGTRITLKNNPEFEVYEESKHGWHNSEEYKKEVENVQS